MPIGQPLEHCLYEPVEDCQILSRSGDVIAHFETYLAADGSERNVTQSQVWGPFGMDGSGADTPACFFPGAFRPFNRHGWLAGSWITDDPWDHDGWQGADLSDWKLAGGNCPLHPGIDYWWDFPSDADNRPRCSNCGWDAGIGTWWSGDYAGSSIVFRCSLCTTIAQLSVFLRGISLSRDERWQYHQQLDTFLGRLVADLCTRSEADNTRYYNTLATARCTARPDDYFGPESDLGNRGAPVIHAYRPPRSNVGTPRFRP
jgi:hypothetical protein